MSYNCKIKVFLLSMHHCSFVLTVLYGMLRLSTSIIQEGLPISYHIPCQKEKSFSINLILSNNFNGHQCIMAKRKMYVSIVFLPFAGFSLYVKNKRFHQITNSYNFCNSQTLKLVTLCLNPKSQNFMTQMYNNYFTLQRSTKYIM